MSDGGRTEASDIAQLFCQPRPERLEAFAAGLGLAIYEKNAP